MSIPLILKDRIEPPLIGRDRVCPQGLRMGRTMANLADRETEKLIRDGEFKEDERCAGCAFKSGTVANGCLQTQMDVLKSVLEKKTFWCHMTEEVGTKVCRGWFATAQAFKNEPVRECPWPISPVT